MKAEQILSMYYDGSVYSFERAFEHSAHSFGGPLEAEFTGIPLGEEPLHHLAELSLYHVADLREKYRVHSVHLIYGFNYDGCEIVYRRTFIGKYEILDLSHRESCDDFPYRNYPPLLPYVPLKISEVRPCSYAEFDDDIPNMAEDQPSDLIVAIPPPATLGVSR